MEFISLACDITQTALAVGSVAASAAPTHRQCDIEIENASTRFILYNPKLYIRRGCCINPLRPRIDSLSSGFMVFSKVPLTACGCAGIFTYDLLGSSTRQATEQIAVLFKVPFDQNLKSNAYAVGVFDISKQCNKYLFEDMSKGLDTTFIRGKAKVPVLIHRSQQVTISATMSDCYTPRLKVTVSDD